MHANTYIRVFSENSLQKCIIKMLETAHKMKGNRILKTALMQCPRYKHENLRFSITRYSNGKKCSEYIRTSQLWKVFD